MTSDTPLGSLREIVGGIARITIPCCCCGRSGRVVAKSTSWQLQIPRGEASAPLFTTDPTSGSGHIRIDARGAQLGCRVESQRIATFVDAAQ